MHISSIGGRNATPFVGAYHASKHAVEALTDSMRVELQPWNIEVVSVMPGAVKTPIWDKSRKASDAMSQHFPARAEELYGAAMAAFRVMAEKSPEQASPPQKVADAVERALTASRPRTRYRVGPDAHVLSTLKATLPDRALDAFFTRLIKLPRRGSAGGDGGVSTS